MLDRPTFYTYARRAPFGHRLTQSQVEGLDIILAEMESSGVTDLRHAAYILATVFHETGGRMEPLREGFAKTDAEARKIVKSRSYGKPDPQTGAVYYGRGYVQLTWIANYAKLGGVINADLVKNPDLALKPDYAVEILIEGMVQGLFTGKKLAHYFNDNVSDPVGARRIINGVDKATLIAGYYEQFLGALKAADLSTPMPTDVSPEEAKPDAPPLVVDKTLWGSVISAIGAGGAGFLSSVNNPWAFAAVAVVVIGGLLLLTGRLQIRRNAGA